MSFKGNIDLSKVFVKTCFQKELFFKFCLNHVLRQVYLHYAKNRPHQRGFPSSFLKFSEKCFVRTA